MKTLTARWLITTAVLCLLVLAGIVIATDDTYTSEKKQKKVYGGAKLLRVQAGRSNALLKFDLSYLPDATTGADVGRALLRLHVRKVRKPGTVDVRQLDGPWSEETVNGLTAPALGLVVIDDYAFDKTHQLGYVNLDVTDLVRNWIDGLVPNNGLAIVPNGDVRLDFTSKESKRSGAPDLDIVLTGGGDPGATGPAGVPGPTGPAGPPGAQGPTGAQGTPGSVGPQGPQGLQGPQGPEGPQGLVGQQGATGPGGAQGAAGQDGSPGVMGPTGPSGPAGPTGTAGNAGLDGANGDSGPMGPMGPMGPEGPMGPTGTSGSVGSIGPQGPEGPQGVPGVAGIQGPSGQDGAQGPAGSTGLTGPAGDSGAAGAQGPTGPAGPVGSQGGLGPIGPQGAQGPQGSTGLQGAQGVPGATGPTGPMGLPGLLIEASMVQDVVVTSTTSTNFIDMPGTSNSPGAGRYVVMLSAQVNSSNGQPDSNCPNADNGGGNNKKHSHDHVAMGLFVDGDPIPGTERSFYVKKHHFGTAFTQTIVTLTEGQTLSGRWKTLDGAVKELHERSLIVMKVD